MVEPRHEHSDARPGPIAIIGLGLAALVAVSLVVAYFVGVTFERKQAERRPAPSPLAERVLPPSPRLQPNEARDLEAWRAGEEQHLRTYAWVDRTLDRVRVPIDVAIAHVATHGLPTWPISAAERQATELRQRADGAPSEKRE